MIVRLQEYFFKTSFLCKLLKSHQINQKQTFIYIFGVYSELCSALRIPTVKSNKKLMRRSARKDGGGVKENEDVE